MLVKKGTFYEKKLEKTKQIVFTVEEVQNRDLQAHLVFVNE